MNNEESEDPRPDSYRERSVSGWRLSDTSSEFYPSLYHSPKGENKIQKSKPPLGGLGVKKRKKIEIYEIRKQHKRYEAPI